MNTTITIGIAVRFEGPRQLGRFLKDLSEAAKILDSVAETEVVFCLNGATEATRDHVEHFVAELDNLELPFRVVQSSPGKINAHRMIASQRKHVGPILFVDADLEFHPDTFRKLFNALEQNPDVWACCADVRALASTSVGLFGYLQNGYYARKRRLPPRKYLHGRCFMLRDWLPEFDVDGSSACSGLPGAQHLNLRKGPLVDDIHYSRVVLHRFGPAAIVQVPDADVVFGPPESLSEFYRDSFRTVFELERLDLLFPEHASLETKVFRPYGSLRKCIGALGSGGVKAGAYVTLEECLRIYAKFQIRTLKRNSSRWKSGNDHHTA